jgi:hypothetical protein
VEPLLQGNDLDFGIDGAERGTRGLHLRRADGVLAVEDLALQVGEIDLIAIGERELSDTACSQVERRRATQAARADYKRACGKQPLLPLDPDFREEDVAAVAEELLVVQAVQVSSVSRPVWSARPTAPGS